MAEQSRLERYKHLPPPVDPQTLRTTQDIDPPPPEEDDTYRELLWVVNRYG
ncbi:hypothetical protein KVF89_13320 [Nocardioides carbamazepini]|uniref:hypothetical protein n=1 Tax=Nocardioides carbamazepini TaxID=2854259 RepID=UPI00214A3517|nr:hypothetical protein [Nocardioides carbamazepini]MCR1783514.1 hypothetical protein [Nocardioides carbamazepini]